MPNSPPPKKRDAHATRARILEAAQHAFSETGYSRTGIRDIAARAGTSSTLLLRYFKSKAGLFEAALDAAMPAGATLEWSKGSYAERLADALLDAGNPVRPPLMIALASGDGEAAAIAARVTEANAIAPMAEWLDGPHRRERAHAIMIAATGFATCLRQLPPNGQGADERDWQRRWFIDTIHALVNGAASTGEKAS